ncbi:MAG: 2-dehydropantoate 2-reductase [Candidatus Omnitrophota bacterium]
MKIAIVGAGAMGCLFAGLLSRTKEEIWLLDKSSDKAARIRQQGITVETASGSWQARPKVTADIAEAGQADLVIICVKAYHTKDAVTQVKPLIGENTRVLTLQNGLGNIEVISEVAGPEKVIGGVTSQGATLVSAGSIKYAGKGETIIGRIDGKIPVEMRSIREVFNKAGIETRISRDIKGLLWSKLIINAGINALAAIVRVKNGRLIELEPCRRIMQDAVSEAAKIAKRKRIKLIYDDPLSKVEAVCEATAANVCSMLQDILKKKRTEIDFINGAIVRQAQGLGIPVPANAMLTDLIKAIEASYNISEVK